MGSAGRVRTGETALRLSCPGGRWDLDTGLPNILWRGPKQALCGRD